MVELYLHSSIHHNDLMLSYFNTGMALALCNVVSVNYNPRYVGGMAVSGDCQFGCNVYRTLSPHIVVEWSAFCIRVRELSTASVV
jgi:hypothetical protein